MATETSKNKPNDSEESSLNVEENGRKYSMEKCRGSRVLQEMTIETVTNTNSSTSEDTVTHTPIAKTPTVSDKGKSIPHQKPSASSAKSAKGKANEKKSNANPQKKVSKNDTGQKEKQKSKNNGGMVNSEKNMYSKPNENSVSTEESTNVLPIEVVTEDVVAKDNLTLPEHANSDPEKRNRLLHPGPISFSSGNHFVEVTKGLLHLYKEK